MHRLDLRDIEINYLTLSTIFDDLHRLPDTDMRKDIEAILVTEEQAHNLPFEYFRDIPVVTE